MKGTSRSGVLELEGSGDTELTIALLSGAVVSCPLSLQGVCKHVSTTPSMFVLTSSMKHIKRDKNRAGQHTARDFPGGWWATH